MNFKTTYVLFGALVALLVLFAATQLAGLRRQTDKTAWVLTSLNGKTPVKAENISKVEIERARPKAETLVFNRTDQGWQLEKPAVRVDNFRVDQAIDAVLHARVEEKADLKADLKTYGLDPPAATVTLTGKDDGKQWKLVIGNDSPGGFDAVVYVTSSDRKDPVAVRKNDLDQLFKGVNDFRSKDLLAASSFNAQAVTVQETGHEPVSLEKASDGKWRFVKPAYGEAEYEGAPGEPPAPGGAKKIAGVRDLLDDLGQIKVDDVKDFVADDVSAKDMAEKYGLDAAKPAKMRVEVKRTASGGLAADKEKDKPPVTEVLLLGKRVEDKDAKDSGDKYYARLEKDTAVVRVAARNIEPLVKVAEAPDVLRNRDLVQVDPAKVDAVNIQNGGGLLKLRKPGLGEGWKLYAGTGPAQTADDRAVPDLLTSLTTKRIIKSFPEPSKSDADLGLDKPTAAIDVWVEGVAKEEKKDEKKEEKKDEAKKEEPKKDADKKGEEKKDVKAEADKASAEPKLKSDKPTIRLVFGKRDGDTVYVRREVGDDKARLAVPALLLEKAQEGALAYLDRTLPPFPADGTVTKVAVVRGGGTYEIEREQKDEKAPAAWKIKLPKALAERNADSHAIENLIGDLRTLQAEKLVAQKASDADLDKYGLKAPAEKVTLTVKNKDGKTAEHVYLFGKDTPDKTGRYAKQGERDVVFTVRDTQVASLKAELSDPTVLAFDLAKVRGLKITGWHEKIGARFTLDLERKGPQDWTAKAPADFHLNKAEAESFLAGHLAGLKAQRFVAFKTGAKPEFKLDPKDALLEIEISVEGEKDPYQLTIGAHSAADKAYYAKVNKLEGDVFLLPEDRFKKVLEGPAYFKAGNP
jgi:hypothetical protein